MAREFTSEGQKLFESIFSFDEIIRSDGDTVVVANNYTNKNGRAEQQVYTLTPDQKELIEIKLELAKMIANSKMVIEDCDEILSQLDTVEDYIKSPAKIAKQLHHGLITRLERILSGLPAFENEDHLKIKLESFSKQDIYKLCR